MLPRVLVTDELVIEARALSRTYAGSPPVRALVHADLDVSRGERVAILGRSGAGKSTLLNILGLLDNPTSGRYSLMGSSVPSLSQRDRDQLRARELGFVFQASHVIGHRTVRENVRLKLTTARVAHHRDELIDGVLARVGLYDLRDAKGVTLSGGERQRVALARAVVAGPSVLLADEPTGNLDDVSTQQVLTLLADMAGEGTAVVVITHDARTTTWADRVLTLRDGELGP